MKSFGILKIAMVLVGFGGAFLLAPQARAQSEVSPDHFDGTDSWAVALAAKDAKAKPSAAHLSVAIRSEAEPTRQAQNNKASLQPVAARTASQTPSAQVVAIQEKRKTSPAPKSQK